MADKLTVEFLLIVDNASNAQTVKGASLNVKIINAVLGVVNAYCGEIEKRCKIY